jgi:hypothetical protein
MTVACRKVGLQQAVGSGNLRGMWAKFKRAGGCPALQGMTPSFSLFDMHCRDRLAGQASFFVCRLPADPRYERNRKKNASDGGSRAFANALRVTWGTGRNARAAEKQRLDNRLDMQYVLYRLT